MAYLTGTDGYGLLGPLDSANLVDGLPMSDFDYIQTIMSQYANSPILCNLIARFAAAINVGSWFGSFYQNIWDVKTASGYGLDVWGRIVGVTRILHVNSSIFFGFGEAGTNSAAPFGQGVFYSGAGSLTSNFAMDDASFRTLIFAKALSNISDGSIVSINNILMSLFPGQGDCWVTDGLNMTMNYSFIQPLSAVNEAIVFQTGVLPRPAGVLIGTEAPPAGGAVWDEFAWDDGSTWQ